VNMTKLKLLLLLAFISQSIFSFGQKKSTIDIPTFNDKYSEFVKNLELGKTDIDYNAFRNSFLESKQYKIKTKSEKKYGDLKKKFMPRRTSLTMKK
jgi:hypothetical protein